MAKQAKTTEKWVKPIALAMVPRKVEGGETVAEIFRRRAITLGHPIDVVKAVGRR
jgi:hypothetical protein